MVCIVLQKCMAPIVATQNLTVENTSSLQSNSFTNNIKSAMSAECLHLDWQGLAILCNWDCDLVAHWCHTSVSFQIKTK